MVCDRESPREIPLLELAAREVDIRHLAAFVANEMAMLFEIRTIPGGLTVHMHLLDQPAGHEGLQTVVHSGEGNHRHGGLRSHEDLGRRGVIPLRDQQVVNVPTLRRIAQGAAAYRLLVIEALLPGFHRTKAAISRNNIKNDSKSRTVLIVKWTLSDAFSSGDTGYRSSAGNDLQRRMLRFLVELFEHGREIDRLGVQLPIFRDFALFQHLETVSLE